MAARTARRAASRARSSHLQLLSLSCALLASLGCGDSTDPVPTCGTFGAATGPELTVGAGLTPTIRWSPNCLATGIFVVRTDGDVPVEPVWLVRTRPGAAGFESGQVYGATPAMAAVEVAPVALTAGASYVVSISIDGATAAVSEFTR